MLPTVSQTIPHDVMLAGLLAVSDPARFSRRAPAIQPATAPNLPGDPWAQGIATLQAMEAPAGFTPLQWLLVQAGCMTVADRADEFRRLGWSVLDCFGADPDTPGAVHAWGLGVVMGRAQLGEVTPALARLVTVGGARQTFHRRSQAWARPVWEVGRPALVAAGPGPGPACDG